MFHVEHARPVSDQKGREMQVLMTVAGAERDREVSPEEADEIIAKFETERFLRYRYDVVRVWEPVQFIVYIRPKDDPWSVVSFMAPVVDYI